MKMVAIKENSAITNQTHISDEVLIDYLKSMGLSVDDDQAKKFVNVAKSFGLNPFLREIYAIPFGKNWNIIVGYEVYIKRAERSGRLKGWRAWTEGSVKNGDLKGCVEIIRADWNTPFYHEVYYDEYNQNNTMWKTKPRTMIKKVAIAQGFRLAFPEELAGIPYTADEIEAVEAVEEVKPIENENKDSLKKEFADYLISQGIPKQAFKSFTDYLKMKAIDITDDEKKIELLNNKDYFNEVINNFLEVSMQG